MALIQASPSTRRTYMGRVLETSEDKRTTTTATKNTLTRNGSLVTDEFHRFYDQCIYLLSCMTMGVDLLIPLYKATAARSRCLPTDASYKPDVALRAYFRAFAEAMLDPMVGSSNEAACGGLSTSPSPPAHMKNLSSVDVARNFFSRNLSAYDTAYHVHLYPTLATGVVKPLDAVRRSMQPVRTPSLMGVSSHHGVSMNTDGASPTMVLSPTTTSCLGPSGSCQLYISGKQAASEPMLCRFIGITHIVRCYAVPNVPNSLTPKRAELPTDTEMIHATLEKGGDWLTVPMERKYSSTPCNDGGRTETLAPSVYRYDKLEFPVGTLREKLCGEGVQRLTTHALMTSQASASTSEEVYCVTRLTIPAVDDDTYDISQHFTAEVFAFISHAIASGGKVLIHCAAGKHRSAAVAAAYLIDLEVPDREGVGSWHGTSLPPSPAAVVERCYSLLKAARPMAEPTPTYKKQLEGFASTVLARAVKIQ